MFGIIGSSTESSAPKDPRTLARLQLQQQTTKSGIMVNAATSGNNNSSSAGCFGDFEQFTSLPKFNNNSNINSLAAPLHHPPLSTNREPNTTTLWRMSAVVTRRFSPKESTFSNSHGGSGSSSRSAAIRLWDPVSNPTSAGICETSTSPRNVYLLVIVGAAFEKWFSHLIPKAVVVIGTVSSTSGMIVEPLASHNDGGGDSKNNNNNNNSVSASIKIVVKDPADICVIGFSDNIVPCGMLLNNGGGNVIHDSNTHTCEVFCNKLKAKACLKHVVQAKKIETAQSIKSNSSNSSNNNTTTKPLTMNQITNSQNFMLNNTNMEQQQKISLFAKANKQRVVAAPPTSRHAGVIPLVQRDSATGAPVLQTVQHPLNNFISPLDLSSFQANNPYSLPNNTKNSLLSAATLMNLPTAFTPSEKMTRKVETHAFVTPEERKNNQQLQGPQRQQQQQSNNNNIKTSVSVASSLVNPQPHPLSNLRPGYPVAPAITLLGTGSKDEAISHPNTKINIFSAFSPSSATKNINNKPASAPTSHFASIIAERTQSQYEFNNNNNSTGSHFGNNTSSSATPANATLSNNNSNNALTSSASSQNASIVNRTLQAAAVESRRRQREEDDLATLEQTQREQREQLVKAKQQQLMRERQNQKMIFASAVSAELKGNNNNNNNHNIAASKLQVPPNSAVQKKSLSTSGVNPSLLAATTMSVPAAKPLFAPMIDATTQAMNMRLIQQQQHHINGSATSSTSALAASLNLPSNFQSLARSAISRNDDLALQARKEEVSDKLAKIEEKAAIFDALDNVTEVQTKAYHCNECRRTTMSKQRLCEEKGHAVSVVTSIKRFYRCGNCKNGKLPGLGELPPVNIPCNKCGASCWERTTAAGGPAARDL